MPNQDVKCLYCEKTKDEIPLLTIQYREATYWICPTHLPLLIHKPGELIGRLPDAEKLTPYE